MPPDWRIRFDAALVDAPSGLAAPPLAIVGTVTLAPPETLSGPVNVLLPVRAKAPPGETFVRLLLPTRVSPAEDVLPLTTPLTASVPVAVFETEKVVVWFRSRLAEIEGAAAPASTTMPVPAAKVPAEAAMLSGPVPAMLTALVELNSRLLTAVVVPSVVA